MTLVLGKMYSHLLDAQNCMLDEFYWDKHVWSQPLSSYEDGPQIIFQPLSSYEDGPEKSLLGTRP